MDKPELLDLIVDAIEKARKESPHSFLELVPSSENGLAAFPKARILSELSKLGSPEKVLEVVLPRRMNKHGVVDGNYDFDVKRGRVFWRRVHSDGFVPVVEETPIPDEDLKICVDLKAGFDDWLTAYRLKRQDDLASLSPLNLAKIYCTVLDIDEKLQVNPSTKVHIDKAFRAYTPLLLGLNFNASEYRQDALTYLQNKSAIKSFEFMSLRYGDDIIVSLDIPRFQRFKARVIQIYQATEKALLPPTPPVQPPNEERAVEPAKDSDILYEVKLTGSREVLLNGVQLSRMDFAGENEIVFGHLFKNPNRTVSVTELEKLLGNTGLKKDLHKIIENIGFRGDLKKAFFDISKTVVRFRNPLTRKDLEEIGIAYLKLPR